MTKEDLEKVIESGNKSELVKLIERAYEDEDTLITIVDILIPDDTE